MKRVIAAGTVAVALAGLAGLVGLVRLGTERPAVAATSTWTTGALAPPASAPPQVHSPRPGRPSAPSTTGPRVVTAVAGGPATPAPVQSPSVPPAFGAVNSPAALMAHLDSLPSGWQASVHSVMSGGLDRSYLVLRPSVIAAGSEVPTVLLMAGRNMNPDQILHISGLAAALAATGPAVLVVPAGWRDSWDAGDCCSSAYVSDVNDVSFIKTVVASVLASTPGVSASDMYAVGFSNGGRMAYRLGCDMPGAWRGFVAVEAVPVESCRSMSPVGVTIIAQQTDPLLTVSNGAPKYVQGFVEPTVVATVNHMSALDRCAGSASGSSATGSRADIGVSVERTWWCAGGSSVRYVWYPGGAHTWRAAGPGTPGATDYVLQMLGRGPLANLPPHSGA